MGGGGVKVEETDKNPQVSHGPEGQHSLNQAGMGEGDGNKNPQASQWPRETALPESGWDGIWGGGGGEGSRWERQIRIHL